MVADPHLLAVALGVTATLLFFKITRGLRTRREERRRKEALKTSGSSTGGTRVQARRRGRNAFEEEEWEGVPVCSFQSHLESCSSFADKEGDRRPEVNRGAAVSVVSSQCREQNGVNFAREERSRLDPDDAGM